MKQVQALIAQQKADRNPGYRIGEFLIDHSIVLEYLEAQLQAYLDAVRADRAEAAKFARHFLKRGNTPFENVVAEAVADLESKGEYNWRGRTVRPYPGHGYTVTGNDQYDTIVAALEAIRDGEV